MPTNLDAPSAATVTNPADEAAFTAVAPPDLTHLTYFRGRVAMAAILRGLGVGAGDEVLIQAFTCIAVPESVLSLGATPRYVDVERQGPNMDPEDLHRKITRRTKAVVIQHSFGLPASVSRLTDVTRATGIPLVEDCAHTIASRVDGRVVGSFGAAAFYSFEAAKPVFAGIGGSALCNDPRLSHVLVEDHQRYHEPSVIVQLQLMAMFIAHRVAYRPSTYWKVRALYRAVVAAGLIKGSYNKVADGVAPAGDFALRMGGLQARLLRRALRDLEAQSAHRRWVADQYRTRIRTPGITHLPVGEGDDPVFGRYPLLSEDRADLIERAREAKVELAVFYATPVHPLEGEELRTVGYEPGSCPHAEWIAERIVSLPTGRQVTRREVDRAVDFFNNYRGRRA